MWTDRQTDGYTERRTIQQTEMTKPIVEFRNFSIAPKISPNVGGFLPDNSTL
jgi:hypothetical protein